MGIVGRYDERAVASSSPRAKLEPGDRSDILNLSEIVPKSMSRAELGEHVYRKIASFEPAERSERGRTEDIATVAKP